VHSLKRSAALASKGPRGPLVADLSSQHAAERVNELFNASHSHRHLQEQTNRLGAQEKRGRGLVRCATSADQCTRAQTAPVGLMAA